MDIRASTGFAGRLAGWGVKGGHGVGSPFFLRGLGGPPRDFFEVVLVVCGTLKMF